MTVNVYRNFPKHGRKLPYTRKIRSFTSVNIPYTITVFRRISPYTITVKYDRNTVTCNTAKYARIRSVNGMYTVVYGVLNHRTGFSFRFFYFSFCFFSAFFISLSAFFISFFRFFYFFFRFFYFSFRFFPNFLDEFSAFCRIF